MTVDRWTELLRVGPGPALRPAQVAALDAAWAVRCEPPGPWGARGVLGLLGCGHGKTLVAQLAPVVLGARAPVLLVPAALVRQVERDVAEWGQVYRIARPRVVTYEALGAVSGARRLEGLDPAPDLLVLDEAHLLASPGSARWARVARYLAARPHVRVVALSGTLTWRDVGQIGHILTAVLRDRTPLPPRVLPHVAAVVDVGGEPSRDDWTVLEAALGPGARTKTDARARLHRAICGVPGVVHAAGVAADVSLTIELRDLPAVPGAAAALADLEGRWVLPDGEELVDAIEVHRARRSLAWGYWSRWAPGSRDRYAAWWAARDAWGAVVRSAVPWRADSPGVALRRARAGELGEAARAAGDAWVTVRRDAPPRETVWLDAGRTGAAAALDAAGRLAPLVWGASRALEEVARELGWATHGAASAAPTPGPRPVWASWRVHGKGWNGQRFHRAAVVEPPDGAGEWEQLLARHHRPGQVDDVEVVVATPSPSGLWPVGRAIRAATYSRDVLGADQRLLLATWPDGRPPAGPDDAEEDRTGGESAWVFSW